MVYYISKFKFKFNFLCEYDEGIINFLEIFFLWDIMIKIIGCIEVLGILWIMCKFKGFIKDNVVIKF